MPFNVSNPVLYFNTKAFEKAGLDPAKPPRTFDDLRSYSQKIMASGAAKHGFALELSPWYVEQWFAMAGEPVVDNQNGRTQRAQKALLDTPIGKQIYAFLKDLVASGEAVSVGRNTGGADHFLALGSGDAAMTIGSSAAIGSILNVLKQGTFPGVGLGIAPLVGPEGDGGTVAGGAAIYLVGKGAS